MRRGFHSNTSLGSDWAELGARLFRFEVIEECSPSQLDQLEEYHIEQEGSFLSGYNSTADGQAISDFEKLAIEQKLPKKSIINRPSPCESQQISYQNIHEEPLRSPYNFNSTNRVGASETDEIQAKGTVKLTLANQLRSQRTKLQGQNKGLNLACRDTVSVQTKCVSSETSNTRTTESKHTNQRNNQTHQECFRSKTLSASGVRYFPKKEYSPQQYITELTKHFPNAEAIVSSTEFNEWLLASTSVIREKSKSLEPSNGVFVLRAFERHKAWKENVQLEKFNKESILSKLKRKITRLRQLF